MTTTSLPVGNCHLRKATKYELVRHGLSLHLATLWGALRTSPDFRIEHPNWKTLVAKRFLAEYGMNLALLAVLQMLILQFLSGLEALVGSVAAVILLPVLSVAQVISDRLRGTCEVYTDPQGNVGMTIKVHARYQDGTVAQWAFLNHYALPVGKREGARIRQALHDEAQTRQIDVLCHAQNEKIAEYYSFEREGCLNLGGARPLLQWVYSTRSQSSLQDKTVKKFDPFGFSSTRDSGQVPLLGNKI